MGQTDSRTDVRLANQGWEALMTAHATLMATYNAEDMWDQVNMREYDVLYTLAKHRTPMRLSEVQSGVLLSQPALSRMVERLVCRGLLSRVTDAADGRAVRISLTEEGAKVQHEVGRAHAKSVAREVGSRLNGEEISELQRLCDKLTR
ncbi:MAG: MarR family winged helix-turn-helix transcriptional regulator [Leucobacter sp.]